MATSCASRVRVAPQLDKPFLSLTRPIPHQLGSSAGARLALSSRRACNRRARGRCVAVALLHQQHEQQQKHSPLLASPAEVQAWFPSTQDGVVGVPGVPNGCAVTDTPSPSRVHEIAATADEDRVQEQLSLLRSIQRSTGLSKAASGAPRASLETFLDPISEGTDDGSFRLLPRKLRIGTSASLNKLAGSPAKAGQVVEADWPLELAQLTENVSISSAPTNQEELAWLLQASGATALLVLQTDASMELLGVNSAELDSCAHKLSVPLFRVAMPEGDDQTQASALPEAVRVLSSLVSTGHKVHVTCLSGTSCGPLVLLGHLTFFQGKEFSDAMAIIKASCPGASPSYAAWEQGKEFMLVGHNMERMTELAQREFQRRIAHGIPGSSLEDWKVAQRQLLMEALQQRVESDVKMTLSLSKAKVQLAQEQAAEQLRQAEASVSEQARLLAQQLEELSRSKAEAEEKARRAMAEAETLKGQLVELTLQESEAREDAVSAAERAVALQAQVGEWQGKERDARASVAFSVERTEALEAALKELRERDEEAEETLRAAQHEMEEAKTRVEELCAEMERVRGVEEAAREAANAMHARAEELSAQVLELQAREAQAQAETEALRQQLSAATVNEEEKEREMAVLRERVAGLEKEARAAQDSMRAANTRVQFFFRVMNRLMEREKEAQQAALQAGDRLAVASAEVETLRKKDSLLTEAWRLAREKIQLLSLQVDGIEGMRTEERRAALAAADGTLQNPEALAVQQELNAAQEREAELSRRVEDLKSQLQDARDRGWGSTGAAAGVEAGDRSFQVSEAQAMLQQQEEVEDKLRTGVAAAEETRQLLVLEIAATQAAAAESKAQVERLNAQVESLRAEAEKGKKAEATVSELRSQLAKARQHTKLARDSEAAAKQRSEFLVRQLERVQKRSETALEEQRRAAAGAEAALRVEIFGLRLREQEARDRARAAAEEVEALKTKLRAVEAREQKTSRALAAAQEQIQFFFRSSTVHKERARRSQAGLAAAQKEMASLHQSVQSLRVLFEQRQTDAKQSLLLMHQLKTMAAELQPRDGTRLAGTVAEPQGKPKEEVSI